MAASGYTPISLYYSTTASAAPTSGNLVNGELAINITDGKLYYKDNTGTVKVIAGAGGAGIAGGSNTQVQYNSSGSLAGSANFIFDGSNVGIGNTPSAWKSSAKALQVGPNGTATVWSNGTSTAEFGANWYLDASAAAIYVNSDYATRYQQTSGYHAWSTASSGTAAGMVTFSERMRVDNSGRLLVGLTSSTANTTAVYQGTSSGSTGGGIVYLARGSSSPADGNALGTLSFSDSGHVVSGSVAAQRDGGTWTSTTSQPTRLVFSTTPDGSATNTERLRITSTGAISVGSSGTATGTSGQVLTSAGSGSAPTWSTPTGVSTGKSIAMAMIFGF